MKYILITILTLISYPVFCQQISPKDSISIYLLNQEYEKAIHSCKDILEDDSTATWAWLPLGQANYSLQKFRSALYAFKEARKSDSLSLSILYALGKTHSALGDNSNAKKSYQQILSIDATQLLARIELARAYINTRNYGPAIEIYLSVIEEDGRNYSYNKELGLSYLKMDSVKLARWYLHNAVNINNRDENLVLQLAGLYNKDSDYDLALNIIQLGLMHDQNSLLLIRYKAYTNYLLKQYPKAIDGLNHVYSEGDTSLFVKKYLGLSLLHLEEFNKSLPLLEQVFFADKSDEENSYYLSQAYSGVGNHEKAIEFLNKILKLINPSPVFSSLIHREIARNYFIQEQWEKAIKYYEISYQFDPLQFQALYSIAVIYDYNFDNKKKAIEYYQFFLDGIEYDPDLEVEHPEGTVSIAKVVSQRIIKLREDLHFEGELKR